MGSHGAVGKGGGGKEKGNPGIADPGAAAPAAASAADKVGWLVPDETNTPGIENEKKKKRKKIQIVETSFRVEHGNGSVLHTLAT